MISTKKSVYRIIAATVLSTLSALSMEKPDEQMQCGKASSLAVDAQVLIDFAKKRYQSGDYNGAEANIDSYLAVHQSLPQEGKAVMLRSLLRQDKKEKVTNFLKEHAIFSPQFDGEVDVHKLIKNVATHIKHADALLDNASFDALNRMASNKKAHTCDPALLLYSAAVRRAREIDGWCTTLVNLAKKDNLTARLLLVLFDKSSDHYAPLMEKLKSVTAADKEWNCILNVIKGAGYQGSILPVFYGVDYALAKKDDHPDLIDSFLEALLPLRIPSDEEEAHRELAKQKPDVSTAITKLSIKNEEAMERYAQEKKGEGIARYLFLTNYFQLSKLLEEKEYEAYSEKIKQMKLYIKSMSEENEDERWHQQIFESLLNARAIQCKEKPTKEVLQKVVKDLLLVAKEKEEAELAIAVFLSESKCKEFWPDVFSLLKSKEKTLYEYCFNVFRKWDKKEKLTEKNKKNLSVLAVFLILMFADDEAPSTQDKREIKKLVELASDKEMITRLPVQLQQELQKTRERFNEDNKRRMSHAIQRKKEQRRGNGRVILVPAIVRPRPAT